MFRFFLCCFLCVGFSACAHEFVDALNALKHCPYGFYFVDAGITLQDIVDFNSIDIQGEYIYQQFGKLEEVESGVAAFLSQIGMNERQLVERVAARLAQITDQIMAASGRETAWIYLRAWIPTDAYDIPRWHVDGFYYIPEREGLMYRFAMSLKGPATLFYPIPTDLRQTASKHLYDRKFLQELCRADLVVAPQMGEGVFFIGGDKERAAWHSEPPIHEKRLFFSIAPCAKKQLVAKRSAS